MGGIPNMLKMVSFLLSEDHVNFIYFFLNILLFISEIISIYICAFQWKNQKEHEIWFILPYKSSLPGTAHTFMFTYDKVY